MFLVHLVLLSGGLFAAELPQGWRESRTSHFEVRMEARLAPAGFQMALERIHSRMRMELSMLIPWSEVGTTQVYLYRSSASYAASPFKPPPWSNGLSLVTKRIIVVYQIPDTEQLLRIVAHEMTHVLFEGYFAEEGKSAPTWLTEGLAMHMETSQRWTGGGEESPWKRKLDNTRRIRLMPFRKFVAASPAQEKTHRGVDAWYLQAYLTVRFLLKSHSRLAFRKFCERIRGGMPIDQALWRSYRYGKAEALDKALIRSLNGDPDQEKFKSADFSPRPIAPSRFKSGFEK